MSAKNFSIKPGKPYPIGATPQDGGVNFSLYSHTAVGVELLLFDKPGSAKPPQVIELDPAVHRSTNYWHVFVAGIGAGQLYGYRVRGEFNPDKGLRFDASKVLLDPYARGIVEDDYDREAAKVHGIDNLATCMKSVVVDPADYDWEGDEPLNRPLNNAVIYEMHVRGFTNDTSSRVKQPHRGT